MKSVANKKLLLDEYTKLEDGTKIDSEIISLFVTPVMKASLNRDFTESELQFLFYNIPMIKDNQGQKMTNHQSKDSYLFDSHADTLKDIKSFCESQIKNYLEEVEGVDTDLAGLRITQSWLNKTKLGEYHNPHHHPNSYLTGVLYISCLPNDCINFNNRMYGYDNWIQFQKNKITQWNTVGHIQEVIEGDLLIFPSWISHSVNMNGTKNRERISLSFNTFPVGELNGVNNLNIQK